MPVVTHMPVCTCVNAEPSQVKAAAGSAHPHWAAASDMLHACVGGAAGTMHPAGVLMATVPGAWGATTMPYFTKK